MRTLDAELMFRPDTLSSIRQCRRPRPATAPLLGCEAKLRQCSRDFTSAMVICRLSRTSLALV